jgi:hypothetical protein
MKVLFIFVGFFLISNLASAKALNCENLFLENHASLAFDGALNEKLAKRIAQIKKLAAKKNFDQVPVVFYLNNAIQKNGKVVFNGDVSLDGLVMVQDRKLIVTVSSMNTNPGILDKMGITSPGRTQGLNASFAKIFYAILRGASERARNEPSIQELTVKANSVINKDLKKMLTDFGFVTPETHQPLTAKEISGPGRDLYLKISIHDLEL